MSTCAPAEPSWLRRDLLPHLGLPADLPVHFIAEKAVTGTDFDPLQCRFSLPPHGVIHNLRPVLTAEELQAEQRTTGERRQRAGGLPVLMVDPRAGLIELRLSRGAHSTTLRGPGYLDFINECSFTVDDVVRIWAFNHRASPSNVEESPLYLVIAKKPTPQT
ncbi:hypothetical protein VPH35_039171 [Triticum aestivum]